MSTLIRLLILAGFLASHAAYAAKLQTSGSNSFSLLGSQYISSSQPYFSDQAEAQGGDLSFALKQNFSFNDRWKAQVQAKDMWAASENWNYVDVHQLYVQYRASSAATISVGRQLHTWSYEESEWQQGLFQPRYRENKMRAEDAGLTGVFISAKGADAGFMIGVLPVYIPDFGAHFYLADQKFESKNPWFRPPPSNFNFRGERGEILYEVERPTNEEVLNNPGVAAKVEYGRRAYSGRASYAYKPMNTFLLGFPSENRVVVSEASDVMMLTAVPRFVYHHVASLDNGWKERDWQFTSNLTYESPERYASRSDWTTQEATPAFITTLSASRYLETPGIGAAAIKFGFFRLWGGDIEDQGVFRGQTSLFERRYQFNEAYSVGLYKEFRGVFGKRLETETRVIYDRLQEGMMMTFNSALLINRNWRAEFQFDVLGLTGAPAQIRDGFVSLYRANDRVGVGMTYVF